MDKVISNDGTPIAYETSGTGPALVLVGGAFCDRHFADPLAELLKERFTVVKYDRRGRGDSGDTQPYSVEREIEDLAAVIEAAGGSAYAFGVSSGAVLAVDAATAGTPIRGLALVEPPYAVHETRTEIPNLAGEYTRLCREGRRGEAVELFMTKAVGQPPEAVEQVRGTPMWPALEAMAHTLAYDATITGDGRLPTERAASIAVPTLAIDSTASPEWLRAAAQAIAAAVPDARHVSVPGQFHQPDNQALATEISSFFHA
jgi:pimeloyl-ACP methyl ester carboxylesterase